MWAELAPLTGDLDRIAAEKRQILEQAEALAEQRRAAAGAQVQAILDDARVAAADIRKRASAGRRSEIQREADQLRVRGADEASRIRSVSKKRIPTLAAEVVDCVLRTPE